MPANYLKYTIYNLAAAAGLYAMLILYVDPTSLLTLSGYKPGFGCTGGIRMNEYNIKPAILASYDFDTVIVGSSRVAAGIDTNTLISTLGVSSGYNAGSPGLYSDNLIKYLNIIDGNKSFHHIYIGLDIGMFIDKKHDQVNTGMMFDYLENNPAHSTLGKAKLFIRSHLFKESIIRSINAIASNADCKTPRVTSLGHLAKRNYAIKIIEQGYQVGANANLDGFRNRYQKYSETNTPSNNYHKLRDNIQKLGASLDQLCKPARSIVILFNPVHADLMVALDDTFPGIITTYKKDITQMVYEHAESGCNISLWDFNVIHPYTTASFPDNHNPDDDSIYFWEPSHYKPALGEILLHRMHGDIDNNFGVKLTTGNIDAHLANQKTLLDEYRQQHAQ